MAMIKSGNLRGSKIEYQAGIGYCVWYPISDEREDMGLCFDFPDEDISDLIKLLYKLKYAIAKAAEDE